MSCNTTQQTKKGHIPPIGRIPPTPTNPDYSKRGRKPILAPEDIIDARKSFYRKGSPLRAHNSEPKLSPRISLPRWIINLFPAHEVTACIEAAILVGSQTPLSGHKIEIPMLHIHDRESAYILHHRFTGAVYERIWDYGDEIGISAFPTIIRTALHQGLRLPGWKVGNFKPIANTEARYTPHEWVSLLLEAGQRPNRPERIPRQVFEDLKVNPVTIGQFLSI